MNDDMEFVETEDEDEIMEMGDLLLGFAWHDEARHWHVAGYSFPETFTDVQVSRLEALAEDIARRLSEEGLSPPVQGDA